MTDKSTESNVVFQALADPTRRLIIDDLQIKDGQTLFEICGRLSMLYDIHMARQSISKHLTILEKAEIIKIEWQGRTKMHYLSTEPIQRISKEWLNKFL